MGSRARARRKGCSARTSSAGNDPPSARTKRISARSNAAASAAGPRSGMRIGIDAREICGHPTGVGRYLAGLLRQWSVTARAHEFVLYAPDTLDIPLDARRFPTRVI